MVLDSAHKTRVPSCDDPAQVPGRKMRLKAGIVQPRSRDTRYGGWGCLFDLVGAALCAAAIGRNASNRAIGGQKSPLDSMARDSYPEDGVGGHGIESF
jgi:hypothetical protein